MTLIYSGPYSADMEYKRRMVPKWSAWFTYKEDLHWGVLSSICSQNYSLNCSVQEGQFDTLVITLSFLDLLVVVVAYYITHLHKNQK